MFGFIGMDISAWICRNIFFFFLHTTWHGPAVKWARVFAFVTLSYTQPLCTHSAASYDGHLPHLSTPLRDCKTFPLPDTAAAVLITSGPLWGQHQIPVSWETQPNGSICVIIFFSTVANRQGNKTARAARTYSSLWLVNPFSSMKIFFFPLQSRDDRLPIGLD